MGKVKEFGICFENLDAKRFIASARLAEELGFGTFWVPEDYFCRGAFAITAAVATQTTSLKVGIGVLNPYTRHPALTAMEFGALDDVAGGRALLGVGASVRLWIEHQLKIPYKRQTRAIRESVEIIRQLFRGEKGSYSGQIFQTTDAHFQFRPTRPEVPIHLGVMGPKKLALAGEIADGVLLGGLVSPAYARYAVEQVRLGAARVGRKLDDFTIGAYLALSVSEDEKAAREAVKPMIAGVTMLMSDYPEHPLFTCGGMSPQEVKRIATAVMQGESPAHLVTEEMIDTFAIAGNPEHCREALTQVIEAGVTVPVAFELPGISPEKLIRDVHEHLMPSFL
jgi:5,10-methylenetetrahydromethanopterin reductase